FLLTSTAAPEISPLSLHDALPISHGADPSIRALFLGGTGHEFHPDGAEVDLALVVREALHLHEGVSLLQQILVPFLEGLRIHSRDRKSTRLNSSHVEISYAVFCLK